MEWEEDEDEEEQIAGLFKRPKERDLDRTMCQCHFLSLQSWGTLLLEVMIARSRPGLLFERGPREHMFSRGRTYAFGIVQAGGIAGRLRDVRYRSFSTLSVHTWALKAQWRPFQQTAY